MNPVSELIDATNLPKANVVVTPIAVATDGTQIWKITHNGVDTHPIHFHLFNVQVHQPRGLGRGDPQAGR